MDVVTLSAAKADAKRRFVHNQRPGVPTGMSWLPFTVLGIDVTGRCVLDKTPRQVFDAIVEAGLTYSAGGVRHYVDSVLGLDTNAGTLAAPIATITKAITLANNFV